MTLPIIFKNAFLIDGTGRPPVPRAMVKIEGARIVQVGQGADLPATLEKAAVIDLAGKTLMPGLIDAHVHPGNVALHLPETVALPPAVYVHRVTRTLETDLKLGFTTLRDAAGLDAGFIQATDEGLIRGPRLHLSITPLNQTGGFVDRLPTPRNSLGIFPEICDGVDEVRRAVRRTLARGARQIKIFADGEVVSQSAHDQTRPGQWKFSIPEIQMAVETAEAGGAYVMAHAYSARAIQNCVRGGVRSIEHGNLLDRETADLMAQHGTFLVPTLSVYDFFIQEGQHLLDAQSLEKLKIVGEEGRKAVRLAQQAGVRIGSGSDFIGPYQHLKGRELAIKAEILSPLAAIESATRINAQLMGLEQSLGTVEPGKRADIIVLDANPLDDMKIFESGLSRVQVVVQQGRMVKNLLGADGGDPVNP